MSERLARRWTLRFLGILTGVWLTAGLVPVAAQRAPRPPLDPSPIRPEELGYALVWRDEFDGHALDPSKWEVRGIGPRGPGFVSPEAVRVRRGRLELSAFRKDGKILIGAVGTQETFMTRYGFFECRARLQRSTGLWSAFWIQSPRIAAGEDPALFGAEIDIFEFFRKLGPDVVSHNVHWAYGPNQKTTRGMQSHCPGVGRGYHTFGLEWTPERYVFYVDGRRYYEVTAGVSRIEEYMILSMELPSKAEELVHAQFPDVFEIDYVRVYQKRTGPQEK